MCIRDRAGDIGLLGIADANVLNQVGGGGSMTGPLDDFEQMLDEKKFAARMKLARGRRTAVDQTPVQVGVKDKGKGVARGGRRGAAGGTRLFQEGVDNMELSD